MKNSQEDIKQELKSLGLTIEKLKEDGRTFQGTGKFHDERCFFKVARSYSDATRLKNSILFAKQLEKNNPPFLFAHILYADVLPESNLYCKIETLVSGLPYAENKDAMGVLGVDDPEAYFPAFVDSMLWLCKLDHLTLLSSFDGEITDPYFSGNTQLTMINTMIKWGQADTPRVVDLLKTVQSSKSTFERTVSHGDLTPINSIAEPSTHSVGFIDLDLGNIKAPMYYDLAEFYNRLFTMVCRPDLARLFLKEAVAHLDTQLEKDRFLHDLLAICAFRAVGNFFEISHIPAGEIKQKRIKFATDFANFIADRKFAEDLI